MMFLFLGRQVPHAAARHTLQDGVVASADGIKLGFGTSQDQIISNDLCRSQGTPEISVIGIIADLKAEPPEQRPELARPEFDGWRLLQGRGGLRAD